MSRNVSMTLAQVVQKNEGRRSGSATGWAAGLIFMASSQMKALKSSPTAPNCRMSGQERASWPATGAGSAGVGGGLIQTSVGGFGVRGGPLTKRSGWAA